MKGGLCATVEGADLMDKPYYHTKPCVPSYRTIIRKLRKIYKETRGECSWKCVSRKNCSRLYPEEKREAVIGVLAHDPRPAYVQDPEVLRRVPLQDMACEFRWKMTF